MSVMFPEKIFTHMEIVKLLNTYMSYGFAKKEFKLFLSLSTLYNFAMSVCRREKSRPVKSAVICFEAAGIMFC